MPISQINALTDAQFATRLPLAVVGQTAVARVSIARPANTTTYAIGDAWSDSDAAPTVPSFAAGRINGGTGRITGLKVICSANQARQTPALPLPAFQVLVLDTTFTALEDNTAVDLSDAEAARLVAIFDVTTGDWIESNPGVGALGNLMANVPPLMLNPPVFACLAGSQDLYIAIRMTNAYTPTSGEVLTLIFDAEQD